MRWRLEGDSFHTEIVNKGKCFMKRSTRQRAAVSRERREAAEKAQRWARWRSLAFLPVLPIVWLIMLCGMPLALLWPTALRQSLTPPADGSGSEELCFVRNCGFIVVGITMLGAVVLIWLG